MLDRGLTKQPPAVLGLIHVDCVRKSTDRRGLKGAANHNACCRDEMGKARCSVCLSIVCLHHSICDHKPHNETKFIEQFLTWKTTDTDPVPRWRFTTWSFMYLADGFAMLPTFRELHLDPDKWLTPMLKFKPTASNPDTSDEYEMFLRLRHMVNSNDRAHAMRCVDTLRIFVQHAILGSVKVTADRKANFTDRPISPSVFESMEVIWPKIFGFLYHNRGE